MENRTVNLAVTTTKLSGRAVAQSALRTLNALEKKLAEAPKGKQSLKALIGQNQGVSSIDIAKTDLRGFKKYARQYGIDYAIVKDKSAEKPRYLVFFKAKDAEALSAALRAYTAEVLDQGRKPSVLKLLHQMMEKVKNTPVKAINKEKQRVQER